MTHPVEMMASFLLKREDTCQVDSEYEDVHWGPRISSIFVIMITSSIGAFFPILASRYSFIRLPSWTFFIAKYFGSGVIIATAFIHLLQPANENLSDECLGGVFAEYPIAFAICLIMIMVMFFIELVAYKYVESLIVKATGVRVDEHTHSHMGEELLAKKEVYEDDSNSSKGAAPGSVAAAGKAGMTVDNHYAHEKSHQDPETAASGEKSATESFLGNLLSVFILEFGIIFHSVFIGLTLACSTDEFVTLYIVLVFHQMFEGLGLGTRIALVEWPKTKRWTPWLLAAAYGLTTPISIAIGIGVRTSYLPGSRTALITNGCFDSISAGILIYTGLIELMAHEFLFSDEFKGHEGVKKMLLAYVIMCTGCGLMALLGKWA